MDDLLEKLSKITGRPTPKIKPLGAPEQDQTSLSQDDLEEVLRRAGWPERLVPTMGAIGMAESALTDDGRAKIDSYNPGFGRGGKRTIEQSIGPWQINMHPSLGRTYDRTRLASDPVYNAKVALDIYNRQGLNAWGAYSDGRYRQFVRQPDSLSQRGPDFVDRLQSVIGNAGQNAREDIADRLAKLTGRVESSTVPTNPTGTSLPITQDQFVPQDPTQVGIPRYQAPAQTTQPSIPAEQTAPAPNTPNRLTPPPAKPTAPVANRNYTEADFAAWKKETGSTSREEFEKQLSSAGPGSVSASIDPNEFKVGDTAVTSNEFERGQVTSDGGTRFANPQVLSKGSDDLNVVLTRYQPGDGVTSEAQAFKQAVLDTGLVTPDQVDSYIARKGVDGLVEGGYVPGDIINVRGTTIADIKGRDETVADLRSQQAQARTDVGFVPGQYVGSQEEADQVDASTNLSGTKYSWSEIPITGVVGDVQNAAAGALASGGRVWGSLAGIYRAAQDLWNQPFGEGHRLINPSKFEDAKAYKGDSVYEFMKGVAEDAQKSGQNLSQYSGTRGEIFQMAGALPGDLSRIMLLSRLPGGVVTGMSADMASQAAGRGESIGKVGAEAFKGALMGSIARFATPVGEGIAANTGSKLAGGVGAMAFTGAATYPTSRLFGADEKTALKETLYNTIFALGDAVPVLAGRTVRVKDTAGEELAVEIKSDGTVEETTLPLDQPADLEVVVPDAVDRLAYRQQIDRADTDATYELYRPLSERLDRAELNVIDGAVEASPEAVSILNEVLAKASENSALPFDPYNSGFRGISVKPEVGRLFVKTLETMRDEAIVGGRAEEGVKLNDFLIKFENILDPEHGDAAIYGNFRGADQVVRGDRTEEMVHIRNNRSGLRKKWDDGVAWDDTPNLNAITDLLNKAYEDKSHATKLDETVAQSFRENAEQHLGATKQELRAARQELFRKLEQDQEFDIYSYAESLEGTSRAGDAFARYGRIKRSQDGLSSESRRQANAAGEAEVGPPVRGLQDERREGTGDSRGPNGRDSGEWSRSQRARFQSGVGETLSVGDFVNIRNEPGKPFIVDQIEGDKTLLRDAFDPTGPNRRRIATQDLELVHKLTDSSEGPAVVDDVDLFTPEGREAFKSPPMAHAFHGSRHRFLPEVLVRNSKTGEEKYLVGDNAPTYPEGSRVTRRGDGSILVRHADGSREIVPESSWLPEVPAGFEVLKKFPLGRMRDDKIGSGEGVQAYGHGHYAAQSKAVADYYREAGKEPDIYQSYQGKEYYQPENPTPRDHAIQRVFDVMTGKDLQPETALAEARRAAQELEGNLSKAVGTLGDNEKAERLRRGISDLSEEIHALSKLDAGDFSIAPRNNNAGFRYRVKINTPDERILSLDNPLESQPEAVQKTLKGLFNSLPELGVNSGSPKRTGADIYASLSRTFGDDSLASSALRERGIEGLKFKDQWSRAIDPSRRSNTHNYIAFSEDAIDVRQIDFASAFKKHKIFDSSVKNDVQEFTEEMFPNLASLWKRRSSGKPLVTNPNATAAERMNASRGMQRDSILSGIAEKAVNVYREFKRQFKEIDPNESIQMARAADSFRLLSSLDSWAKTQAANDVARITESLSREQYDVLENVLVLRDKQQAVEQGLKPGHGYNNLADVESSLKVYEQAATSDAVIAKALANREALRLRVVKDLVDVGMLGEPALRNTRYFHRQVPQAENNLWVSLGSRDVRIRNKGFQKERAGTEDYNTNYLESEVEWLSQAHTQIRKQELLNEIQRNLDIADDLKAQARVQGVGDWKDLINRNTHTIWQPKEGSYFYTAMSIPDQLLTDIFAGKHTPQSARKELVEVIAQGQRRPEWVLPKGAAKLMNDFEVQPVESAIGQISASAMGTWKQWMLINPKNFASYNIRNFISDLDAAMPYPGVVKELPAAIKDIYKYSRSRSGPAVPEIEQAIKDGVMDSGMTFTEIPDISKMGVFKVFADSDWNIVSTSLNKVWDAMKNTTNARENWIRLAAYRYMKKRIDAGDTIYAASTAGQIKALDPGRQAAKLARELVGDYAGTSEASRTISKHMLPFYRWLELNAPRYVRMIKNMPAEASSRPSLSGFALGKGLKVAHGGASLATKMVAMTAAINAWNHLMFPEIEDKFQKTDLGRRPHLIVGTYPDGSARVFQADTALRDAMDWVGAGDLVADIEDLATQKASISDKIAEAIKAPVERVVQGAAPQYKLPYELLTRESAYPSIFEKGSSFSLQTRPVRDRAEYLAQAFAVKGLYQRIMGRPIPPSSGPVGQVADWFVTQRIDPEESIFWNVRSKVSDYRKKMGKSVGGDDPTDRSNTLFYYKQALKWGNEMAADRYLKEYRELGGTDAGLKMSLQRTHPLGGLAKKDWPEYVNRLTPEERDQLKVAIQFYDETYKKTGQSSPADGTTPEDLMEMLFPNGKGLRQVQAELEKDRRQSVRGGQ